MEPALAYISGQSAFLHGYGDLLVQIKGGIPRSQAFFDGKWNEGVEHGGAVVDACLKTLLFVALHAVCQPRKHVFDQTFAFVSAHGVKGQGFWGGSNAQMHGRLQLQKACSKIVGGARWCHGGLLILRQSCHVDAVLP